jgi:cell division protein FtsQ
MTIMLPEGHEAAALTRLGELQTDQALLDRPLVFIDMRLPDRLAVRARPAPPATSPSSAAPEKLTPPGLTPPGLAPPGLAPPGLAPPGLAPEKIMTEPGSRRAT